MINIKQMAEAMYVTQEDVFVSWLPVYHDMGLILNTMVPLYKGACLVLLGEGLHNIRYWLKAIEKYKGTFISAPDTAYRLCTNGIRNHSDYDLSSLRVALNASEPIHLETCKMFEEAFKLKNVMISGYGLAEATVAVTMHPPSKPLKADEKNYVSSGLPLTGIDIKIKNGSNQNKSGEIMVKSPALMKGYFNLKNGSELFNKDGFLSTGDIGYIDQEGYLFVLARKKNIIKQAGHTLYPDDVEQVVKEFEYVRQAAAIGVECRKTRGESLMVFVEMKGFVPPPVNICHEMVLEIVQKIYTHFGIRPGKVFLIKPKMIPRTPNGKLQHTILKNLFLHEPSQINNWILYPK
jgi:acyl-CoA synthetase (AMP-forming)/AMP-acid ligase II